MCDSRPEWRRSNKRARPASEGELLEPERRLGHLSAKLRARVLGMFNVYINGTPGPISHLQLRDQEFGGVTFVGAVSTLHGQEGLRSQCLWYKDDCFDWFWTEIKDVTAITLRLDPRFRGSTPCLWLTTPIAEYALTSAHSSFVNDWENVLDFFKIGPCDAWPMQGNRPHWWPLQSSGQWPGDLRLGELPAVVPAEVELEQLTEQLSMQPCSSRVPWHRLGPKGDKRFPGHPMHHLSQLQEWELAHNAGLKVTYELEDVGPGARLGRGGPVVQPGGPAKRKTEASDVGGRAPKRGG